MWGRVEIFRKEMGFVRRSFLRVKLYLSRVGRFIGFRVFWEMVIEV